MSQQTNYPFAHATLYVKQGSIFSETPFVSTPSRETFYGQLLSDNTLASKRSCENHSSVYFLPGTRFCSNYSRAGMFRRIFTDASAMNITILPLHSCTYYGR